MPSESGYSNQKKLGRPEFKTIQNLGSQKFGAPTANRGLYAFELGLTVGVVVHSNITGFTTIQVPSHNSQVDDVIRVMDGPLVGLELIVVALAGADYVRVLPIVDLTVDLSGSLVDVCRWVTQGLGADGGISVAFPSGLSTEAKQDDQIVQETATNTKLDTLIAKDFATSAKQDTGNTSLATIAGKDFATSAKQDTLNTSVTSTNTKLDTLIAKDFATSAKQDTGNTSLATIAGKDFATSAKQDTLNTTLTDNGVLLGAVNETAPASDTANSGLNGRLQRIAQRITSLIALFPTSLGQKTMAASLAVVVASDQSSLPVVQQALTGSFQEILTLTTVQTFTAPANAKWCKVYADDTNTANVRVKIGAAATITSGIQLQPGRAEDFSIAGNVSVISESGTQKVNVHFGV